MFDGPYFHEVALRLDQPVTAVLDALASRDILGGLELAPYCPELGNALLVCATETKTVEDIDAYIGAMAEVLSSQSLKTA